MLRSRPAVLLTSAALLAALLACTAAADDADALSVPVQRGSSLLSSGPDLENPSTTDLRVLRARIVLGNELPAAKSFLGDVRAQETVKAADASAYLEVFARATELVDLERVLDGESTVHSIRQSLSQRPGCAFCLDGVAFPAWARRNIPGIGEAKLKSLGLVLWNWDDLSDVQQAWGKTRKKQAAWPALAFPARHEEMRAWALAERDRLMKASPADAEAASAFGGRAYVLSEVLSSHEMSGLWKRSGEIRQSFQSLAEARARVAMGSDPRQKALLAQAMAAATPEAR
ncbi:MAG: hypothetical protein AAB262_04315, partial [Elusimicrobiota bacterium]